VIQILPLLDIFMKKNKPADRQAPDFKNSPFKSLKGFAPQPSNDPSPPRKRNEQREDDSELFFRAMAGTKQLTPGENADKSSSTGKTDKQATVESIPLEQKDKQLFLQAMKKIGTTATEVRRIEEISQEKPRSASSRMRQLKRGTIRVSGELDLHGFLRDEALTKLEHFVSSAYARGREAVLVITGKGINSPDGPVLQGAVAAWLREQGKRMVAEFVAAPRDLGGSGAFVVFLRKK